MCPGMTHSKSLKGDTLVARICSNRKGRIRTGVAMLATSSAVLLTMAIMPVSSASAAAPPGYVIARTITGPDVSGQDWEPLLLVDDVHHHLIAAWSTEGGEKHEIRVIDESTGAVISSRIASPVNWSYLAVDPALGNLYLSGDGSGITVLDATSLETKATVGSGWIASLAVNRATNELYARTSDGLSIYDANNGFSSTTVNIEPQIGFQSIAVDANRNLVYVATDDGEVDSSGYWIGSVTRIDGVTHVQQKFTSNDLQGVTAPWNLAVDPESGRVFVADYYYGKIDMIDGDTVTNIPGPQGSDQTEIGIADGVLYAALGWNGIEAFSPTDGFTQRLLPKNDAFSMAVDSSSGAIFIGQDPEARPDDTVPSRILEISPTTTAQTPTELALTKAESGSGAPISYTATLTPSASGGTVAFIQDGREVIGCAAVPLQAGSARCDAGTAVAGPHTITAIYTGSSDFGMSSASDTFSIAVGSGSASGGSGGSTAQTPGSTTSSDPVGTVPTSANRLVVSVESPVSGPVTITKQSTSTFFPGYTAIGASSVIVAPQASVTAPLSLTFKVYIADMPAEFFPADVAVFRNGSSVPMCQGSTIADPDPCVTGESVSGGVQTFTVLTSRASTWDLEASNVTRASGADRYATAIAVSQTGFLDHSASAVVLATGDEYPDALVGTPLAAAKAGPLLLTHGASLPAATKSEIQRVLKPGGTVYVLGGTAVVPQAVADSLVDLGYKVVRYSGQDRYGTAVKVAEALGSPATVLLATGRGFADALAAGTGAAKAGGAVLLTDGDSLPDVTVAYLKSFHGTLQAVGGPAASAVPTAKPLVGADRYQTSVAVAQALFPNPTGVGVATGSAFPDALAGGALLGKLGQPLVLASPSGLSRKVTEYLTGVKGTAITARLFGGTGVLPASVQSSVASALGQAG